MRQFFCGASIRYKDYYFNGRENIATTRRMNEMKVEYLIQNCKNKKIFAGVYGRTKHLKRRNRIFV